MENQEPREFKETRNSGWINKSEVKKRIEQDIESWRTKIRLVQPTIPITMDRLCGVSSNNYMGRFKKKKTRPQRLLSNTHNDVTAAIERAIVENDYPAAATAFCMPQKPIGLARVTFSYSDKQTSVQLRPGDTVNVIKWVDDLGNSEWALIRVGKSSDFYYPSNRLQPIG
ncbi:hypothetical protein ACTXT7_011111 [Hymenolepis weldensis]